MSDALSFLPTTDEIQERYRVRLLADAQVAEDGIAYGPEVEPGESRLIPWGRILRAVASEIGEPEGIRIIVFDLLVGLEGDGCDVVRLDAEPGEEAMTLALALERALDSSRLTGSIKSLATDGTPTRWYPDLESFEAAALREALEI